MAIANVALNDKTGVVQMITLFTLNIGTDDYLIYPKYWNFLTPYHIGSKV